MKGVSYPSIGQAAAAHGQDIAKVYDRFSEKGWSLEQALGLAPPPDSIKFIGKEIVAFGTCYKSIASAAKAHGIEPESLRKRLLKGETPEVAIASARARKHKRG